MDITYQGMVQRLVSFFEKNANKFESVSPREPYNHMGATIVDAVLQAGLNYNHVVYPRVEVLLKNYPDWRTTCDFIILFQTIPLTELINWRNGNKLSLIHELSWLLYSNQIENESELAKWLSRESNVNKLLSLTGVGPKTVDYLKMLSGMEAIAVDRHLFNFLKMADIVVDTYEEANYIYRQAARQINVTEYELDKKIWSFMSN